MEQDAVILIKVLASQFYLQNEKEKIVKPGR